jgi:hypothetical protein
MKKITLIVGAGVNKEINANIGLGKDLIQDIADRVTDRKSPTNPYLSELLDSQLNLNFSTRSNFVNHLDRYIKTVDYPSIDHFLNEIETYPEFENERNQFLQIGITSIIFHILGYEGTTTENNIKDHVRLKKKSWLNVLCNFIETENLLKGNSSVELNIITFNYDRILEYYLIERFGPTNLVFAFIQKHVKHIYGRVGYFSGIIPISKEEPEISFGYPNDNIKGINKLQNQISLMYDARNNNAGINTIVFGSRQIFSMGYGFDDLNNIRLGLSSLNSIEEIPFKANLFPGNDPDFGYRRKLSAKIRNMAIHAEIHYKTCSDFLNECLFQKTS